MERNAGGQGLTAHIITPETETTCHYWFAHSRDFRVDDKSMDESIANWQQVGFGEQDRGMLKAVQIAMDGKDFKEVHPIVLPIDSAAVRARRITDPILERESQALLEPKELPEAEVAHSGAVL